MLLIKVTGGMETAFRKVLATAQYSDSETERAGLFQDALASAIGEGIIYNPSMSEKVQAEMIVLRDAYAEQFDASNPSTFGVTIEFVED